MCLAVDGGSPPRIENQQITKDFVRVAGASLGHLGMPIGREEPDRT
jgi:hypothetical protein